VRVEEEDESDGGKHAQVEGGVDVEGRVDRGMMSADVEWTC